MYPGKLLSLTNKGWSWAPLLKHVGIWVKKVSYMLKKKKERITRKVWRILEQIKWRSKDQKFQEFKKLKIPKIKQQGGEFKEIKDQMSKKWRILKELHSGIINCNCLDYVCLGCSTKNTLRLRGFLRMDSEGCIKWALFGKSGRMFMRIVSIWSMGGY